MGNQASDTIAVFRADAAGTMTFIADRDVCLSPRRSAGDRSVAYLSGEATWATLRGGPWPTPRRPIHPMSCRSRRIGWIVGTLGLLMPALILVFARRASDAGAAALGAAVVRQRVLLHRGGRRVRGRAVRAVAVPVQLPGEKGVKADRIVGFVGGIAALFVALFPTGLRRACPRPDWWSAPTAVVHYVAAVVLFLSFILFAIWLFRRSDKRRRRDRDPGQEFCDDVCLGCGLVMIACVLWAAIAKYLVKPIFWPESIAIIAFAVSWLAKGEALTPILDVAHRRMGGRPAGGGQGQSTKSTV